MPTKDQDEEPKTATAVMKMHYKNPNNAIMTLACLREDAALLPRSRALAERLLTGVDARLSPLRRDRVYQLACLYDPRVKGSLAGSVADLQAWKAELCREVCMAAATQGQPLPRAQASQSEAEEGSSQGSSSSGGYTQRPVLAAFCGLLYLYGRYSYFTGYARSAEERLAPMYFSAGVLCILIVLSVVGLTIHFVSLLHF
ncbi:hypothetical protein JRQ81_002578 [Phrynocephalus forsythii]|uniref:Uncharacterized protein n=1 Tax=Phrynocephalus forsythii TaxID=171643 RepID=A0A9Q0XIX1_9SAUR|nr:hypothetical protein JRQ81_002578 [Phrynocephalus forsythii]